jgi:hypothetical protein
MGLLVLDAHKTEFDIFRTAAWVRKKYNPKKIYLPIAAFFLYLPILKGYIQFFSKKHSITLLPVYRASDTEDTIPARFFHSFYPKSLTEAYKEKQNNFYLSTCIKAIHSKNEVVVISPYGGNTYYGGKIKYGVRKLIAHNPVTFLTRTRLGTNIIHVNPKLLKGKYNKNLREFFDAL